MVVSRFTFVLVWLGSAVGTAAYAGDVNESAARSLFLEARELVEVGDYRAACAKFEESYRMDPGIGTSFNLADCQEHLGRTASAWSRFVTVAAATRAAGQRERERVALARAASLAPRLCRLNVEVAGPPPPGLTIRKDGEVLSSGEWGVAIPVDPGGYTIEATAPGKVKWSTVAIIGAEAAGHTFTLAVPSMGDTPQSPGPSATRAAVVIAAGAPTSDHRTLIPASNGRRLSTGAVGLGSIGAVSLVSALVFAIKFDAEDSKARSLCSVDNLCLDEVERSRHESLVADARRDRSIFYLSTAVGSATTIVAFYLWWRSGSAMSADGAPASPIAVRPVVAPGRFAASIDFAW